MDNGEHGHFGHLVLLLVALEQETEHEDVIIPHQHSLDHRVLETQMNLVHVLVAAVQVLFSKSYIWFFKFN